MAYFKINDTDLSEYVSGLKVSKAASYSAQTNAAGNTVVDFINSKRTVEVSFITVDDAKMKIIGPLIDNFNVSITYRDPSNGELETFAAYLPNKEIEYYTIRADKVLFKSFNITFSEL